MDIKTNIKPNCGLANILFMVFGSSKDYDIHNDILLIDPNIKLYHLRVLLDFGCTVKYDNNSHFAGYKQDISLFDLNKLRSIITFPKYLTKHIYKNVPDIENRCVIHVRRGDYLYEIHTQLYNTIDKDYIVNTYNKYYKNIPVYIISDDIDWCKENLSDLCNDVKFSVFNDDPVLDLLSISLAKCVICSASSFSMFGIYLNKNNDCVVPFPYYKYNKWFANGEKIVPDFAKREKIKG